MTCGSERSGIASSLALRIENTAPSVAKAMPKRTMSRFLAQNSMMRAIIAPLFPRLRDGVLAVLFHRPHAVVDQLALPALLVLVRLLSLIEVGGAARSLSRASRGRHRLLLALGGLALDRRPEARLRGHQEVAGGHHHVSLRDAREDLHLAVG